MQKTPATSLRTHAALALLLAFTALLWTAHLAAQTPNATYQPVNVFDPKRDAAKDIDAAVAEARRTHRHVLIDVGGEWCIWCKYFDAFFEQHADLKKLRDDNYVEMKLNFSKQNENKAVLSRYGEIEGYPHLIVLDETGKLLVSQETSVLEEGRGYNIKAVSDFLRKWAPKN